MKEEKYLKCKEAARMLGIGSGTLAYWRWKSIHPELRFIKRGHYIRYEREAILEFLKAD